MSLLIFHLVLSSFTYDGVDILMAQKILDWNLKRYPNGETLREPVSLCSDKMFRFSRAPPTSTVCAKACSSSSVRVASAYAGVNPNALLNVIKKRWLPKINIVTCTIFHSGRWPYRI